VLDASNRTNAVRYQQQQQLWNTTDQLMFKYTVEGSQVIRTRILGEISQHDKLKHMPGDIVATLEAIAGQQFWGSEDIHIAMR
jgi:hypothetical protein